MQMTALVSCIVLVLLAGAPCLLCSAAAAEDSQECAALGFTGEGSCADCEVFADIVKDEELAGDCRKCCIHNEEEAKYTSARLEVCPYRLSGLPQLQDFLDKKASAFKDQLKVVQRVGVYPRLILSGPDGKSSVSIDNWKTSVIVDFLQDKLSQRADSK